jgi:anti-sigma factor RsiW
VQCPEALRVQAFFDAELDAVTASDTERHMEHCAECRTLYQSLEELRTALRRDLPFWQTPPALRTQLMRALGEEPVADLPQTSGRRSAHWRTRSFWWGAFGGLGTAAVAATLALWLLTPPIGNPVIDGVLSAHVSSLMSAHLVDVVSTDRHTVKPWFAGHTDVSPLVADFAAQGYTLVGGRVDYLEHQRAAVVVYRHGLHVINVFSWAATQHSLPRQTTRKGYHLVFWQLGDLQYCAVSDTSWDELLGLARLLQDLGARDAH